jgi:hypothetical protein
MHHHFQQASNQSSDFPIMPLQPVSSAFLSSSAVQSFSDLVACTTTTFLHHTNLAASHYSVMSLMVQCTVLFLASILTYSGLKVLCRRLRQGFYSQLASCVADVFGERSEHEGVCLVSRGLFRDHLAGEGLEGRMLVIDAELAARLGLLGMFVKSLHSPDLFLDYRSIFITKEESSIFVLGKKDETRFDLLQRLITVLSRQLEGCLARDETEKAFMMEEDHLTSVPRQHEATGLDGSAGVADSV